MSVNLGSKVGREAIIFAGAFFSSLFANYVTYKSVGNVGKQNAAQRLGSCINNRLKKLPQPHSPVDIANAVSDCSRAAEGLAEFDSDAWSRSKIYASIGSPFSFFFGGAMVALYYGMDVTFEGESFQSKKTLPAAISFGVIMWVINSALLTMGKPTAKYEPAIYAALMAFIASTTSAFVHEFYENNK